MKKAFTLIELLAVIIVLGILAVIINPIVSGLITDSKRKTSEKSVLGYVKSIEFAQVEYQYKNEGSLADDISSLELTTSDSKNIESYNIDFDNGGMVKSGVFVVNEFICIYTDGDAVCKDKSSYVGNPEILSGSYNDNGSVTIVAKDVSGAKIGYYYNSVNNTTPDVNDDNWIPCTGEEITFEPVNENEVYVFVKDNAGNISEAFDVIQNVVLYDSGNEYTDVTGGWEGYIYWKHVDPYDSTNTALSYYWQKNASTLEFGDNGREYGKVTSYGDAAFSPKNKIDFSKFSKLIVTYEIRNVFLNLLPYGAHTCSFNILISDVANANTFETNKTTIKSLATKINVSRSTVEIDISELNETKYLILASADGYQWDDTQSIYVYSVLLSN